MEFAVAGVRYRALRLDARAQYRLLRRLAPVLPALSALALAGEGSTSFAATAAFAEADEAAAQAAIDGCLALAERRDGEGWRPAAEDAATMPLSDTLRIVASVVAVNFAPYFEVERPSFRPSTRRGPDFDPVTLPGEMDWFYRPMMRGLCKYTDLVDGTLHIEDVAELNTVIDISEENQHRAARAAEKNRA